MALCSGHEHGRRLLRAEILWGQGPQFSWATTSADSAAMWTLWGRKNEGGLRCIGEWRWLLIYLWPKCIYNAQMNLIFSFGAAVFGHAKLAWQQIWATFDFWSEAQYWSSVAWKQWGQYPIMDFTQVLLHFHQNVTVSTVPNGFDCLARISVCNITLFGACVRGWFCCGDILFLRGNLKTQRCKR